MEVFRDPTVAQVVGGSAGAGRDENPDRDRRSPRGREAAASSILRMGSGLPSPSRSRRPSGRDDAAAGQSLPRRYRAAGMARRPGGTGLHLRLPCSGTGAGGVVPGAAGGSAVLSGKRKEAAHTRRRRRRAGVLPRLRRGRQLGAGRRAGSGTVRSAARPGGRGFRLLPGVGEADGPAVGGAVGEEDPAPAGSGAPRPRLGRPVPEGCRGCGTPRPARAGLGPVPALPSAPEPESVHFSRPIDGWGGEADRGGAAPGAVGAARGRRGGGGGAVLFPARAAGSAGVGRGFGRRRRGAADGGGLAQPPLK